MRQPTAEQVRLARERLGYFETQLAKTLSGENEQYPIGADDHDWCVRYYQTEVAERTLVLALWDHVMAAPGDRGTPTKTAADPGRT